MRRNKRSNNKIELLKETESACAYLSEKASKRETVRKIETNRLAAFGNFTRAERVRLENAHKLNRVKYFSEYLLRMPKFFDEPEFYMEYCRNVRYIKTAGFARIIIVLLHFWFFQCIKVSGGEKIALSFYFITLPFVIYLALKRDLHKFTGNLSNG